jgi:uncharacterized protein involved in response to NO
VTNEAGGIPRYRETSLPPLFSQGFRPFFLAAAVWAPISLCIWLAELADLFELPTNFVGSSWHAHEMIFGFAAAAMAGYLMTAVPNWTGRMPLQGPSLVILFMTWLAGRLAIAVSAWIGAVLTAGVDLAFPVVLILVIGREICVGRNWRNLPMIAALCLLLAANAASHLGAAGLLTDGIGIGSRGGVAIFVGLISMVGGRVIPSFTRNRLAKAGLPQRPSAFAVLDRVVLFSVVVALVAWVAGLPSTITGSLLVLAGILSAVRLVRWRGWLVFEDPSLWILHLGYGWLAIGLVFLGGSELWPHMPAMAGLHAIGAGAIGSSILGVMGRATLSQTGRRATFVAGTNTIYVLITVGAALRVVAAYPSDSDWFLLSASAGAWILAFAGFIVLYGPALIKPKGVPSLRKKQG